MIDVLKNNLWQN